MAAAMALMLTACGGDVDDVTLAQGSKASVTGTSPGVSPFIEIIRLQSDNLDNLKSVQFEIQAKAGAFARPVNVTESKAWLVQHGYLASGSKELRVPVFGLYSNYTNAVALELRFDDSSYRRFAVNVPAAVYQDPNSVYDHLQVLTRRSVGSVLGFDYFFLKSGIGEPVVVDTDGEIRWVGDSSVSVSASSILVDGAFLIGDESSVAISDLSLDGSVARGQVSNSIFTDFHHNIDLGKVGFLAEFDAVQNGAPYLETDLAEITRDGTIINEWDLGQIIGQYMQAQGDDPSLFVRPGTDWFHMNASLYDPLDDSIIVSSRENFLIKIDYSTKQIKWIFGDTTKYWYTFPSLRAKALTLPTGLYPIGQHGIALTPTHDLLLLNNGYPSFRQPIGAPSGDSRSYTAVDAYSIDEGNRTVAQLWNFDYGQSIDSTICGNAAPAADGSVLVNYAYANPSAPQGAQNRLVALDSSHNVVFDFALPTALCQTTFNAQFINLASLSL